MRFGSTAINAVKLGATQIQKVMYGALKVWENWVLDSGETELVSAYINGWNSYGSNAGLSGSYTFTANERPKALRGTISITNVSGNESHSYSWNVRIVVNGSTVTLDSGSGELAKSSSFGKTVNVDLEALGYDLDKVTSVSIYANSGYGTKSLKVYGTMYRKGN